MLCYNYAKDRNFLICQLIYKTSHGNIHALENVEFQLEEGESIGIAGESACGKSTLGLTIIRMLQGGNIVSGKITFSGESILDMSDSKF